MSEFTQLHLSETRIPNLEATEAKNKFATARLGELKNIYQRMLKEALGDDLYQKIPNFLPLAGNYFMLKKAISGQEGEKELTALERLNYLTIVTTAILSIYSTYQGNFSEAAIERAISMTLLDIDALPSVLEKMALKYEKTNPKISEIFTYFADFIKNNQTAIHDFGEVFKKGGLTTLGNLNRA